MKNKHLRNILIILVVSIGITFAFDFAYGGSNIHIVNIALNTLYGVIIGSSISLSGVISQFIVRKFDIEANPVKAYVILLISIFLFITIDVIFINTLWYRYVLGAPFERIFTNTSVIVSSIITIFVGLTIFFIILSKTFMTKFIVSEKERQKAIQDSETAKFETLKFQINPHFLFNSLNSLSSLIHIDVNKADEFTNKLSKIYRYILDHQDDDLVTLKDEIGFVKEYAYLQSIRFDNNFSIELVDIGKYENMMIIPMSLQLILENVFKHNIISEAEKIVISIEIKDDYIIINNNKNRKKSAEVSHNVGLANIIKRYELICDKKCTIQNSSNYFTVGIPLISEN